MYINHEEVYELLEEGKKATREDIVNILEKAREQKGISHKDIAALLQLEDKELEEEMFKVAGEIKKSIYGKRVVLFAPLYISDYCVNNCVYCGYKKCNSFNRRKLAHYEDLEEQLEKLYGGKMPLDEVVENLNRIVQSGEEKLDYARILTNAEAEKWDKWKDLEEQGRLIELPCLPNEEVWLSNKRFGTHKTIYASRGAIVGAIEAGYAIGYTKEAAEAKLAETRGAE